MCVGAGGGRKWDKEGGWVKGVASEWGEGVEIVEFAMGRAAGDWNKDDPVEGEEGAVDVGAGDGFEEVSLEI